MQALISSPAWSLNTSVLNEFTAVPNSPFVLRAGKCKCVLVNWIVTVYPALSRTDKLDFIRKALEGGVQ